METGRAFMNGVGGRPAPAIKRGDIPVIDPSDGQEFTTIARGGSEDVDVGVLAARRAYGTVGCRRTRPIPDETVGTNPRASFRTG